MERISNENLKLLLNDFFIWYKNDDHSKNENAYSEFQNKSFWQNLSFDEFKNTLIDFYDNGGKVQSVDKRLRNNVVNSITENIDSLRSKILELFDVQFDLSKDWWESFVKLINGAGKGFFSILLHRIDPWKFIILNNKSLAGLIELGYLESEPSNEFKKYELSKKLIDELIEDSKLDLSYYQVDALWQYVIGLKFGTQYLPKNMNENELGEIIESQFNQINLKGKVFLNQILYGPPGTGKTYITKRKALEIIVSKENVNDENIDNLYEQYKDQIKFVTFHQSYSYEQFVEGIGVDTIDNKIVYSKSNGIFKALSRDYYIKIYFAKKNKNSYTFKKQLGNNYDMFKKGKFNVLVRVNKTIVFTEFSKDLISGDELIFSKVNHDKIPEDTPFTIELFYPVVLIIDEINRGNISKIFGELITLIEDDKRLGEDNEIIVKLPYSQEDFGVPPNLYIIGTMNTADRSLVQIDTALRRRFVFKEMMPKYDDSIWKEKYENEKFDLKKFLKNLNDKITEHLDREHQIGHSYLMKVTTKDELQIAWENKILPLLQEYFYADYETLGKIIGNDSNYLKDKTLNMECIPENFEKEFQNIYDNVIKK